MGSKATLDSALGRAASRKPDVFMATRRHVAGFLQHLATGLPGVDGKIMLGIPVPPGQAAGVLDPLAVIASPDAGKQACLDPDFGPDTWSWTARKPPPK
jgi:hypothetical protein